MSAKKIQISQIKPNEHNPRDITEEKFDKLVKSIQDFPQMLEVRPLVIDENNVVLGGNMRLRALDKAGIAEVPVEQVTDWTEEQKNEFIIKDNIGYGEWDWEMLGNEWNKDELEEWGILVPEIAEDIDYSILDDEDIDEQINAMQEGVKKAIQIEFEANDYQEAYELIGFWRSKGIYVGGAIMDFLKDKKNDL